MLCQYTFDVQATCPVNGARDLYVVTVMSERMIQVEDLLSIADAYREQTVFQEELTQHIAIALRATVITEGFHSNVKTRVQCSG